MSTRDQAISDLVLANKILATQGVLDAYGHISIRDPEDPGIFFQSCSRSAYLVEAQDIMQFHLDGSRVDDDDIRPPYLERFIHAAIYQARPDFTCVIHAHTESILPFTVTETPFVPVFHQASEIGHQAVKWDIRTRFGSETDLLVSDMDQGRDLAAALGDGSLALMRGHGYALGGATVVRTVSTAVDLGVNARVLLAAHQLGGPIITLSPGESKARRNANTGEAFDPDGPAVRRGWDYWAARATQENQPMPHITLANPS